QPAKDKAIVTRISYRKVSVTVVCSDKTGALTTNKLAIDCNTKKIYGFFSTKDVLLAAYASHIKKQDA
ncbi:hypothetical protein BKA70DRAFT_1046606, partial [Coprinopsis sp. MPI-PUGE-AT-0042]